MNDSFTIEVDGRVFKATWFEKEDDRLAEWYISVNGNTVARWAGRHDEEQYVENFIRFFVAKKF